MTIKIDPEFKSLLAPLSPEEYNQLQANIEADGCREPLVIWKGEDILVDGHNRLEICNELGDYVTMKLFEELLSDEEGHIDFLETQLELIKQLGVQLYSQKHVGELHS